MPQERVISPQAGRSVVQLDIGGDLIGLPDFTYVSGEVTWARNSWQTHRHLYQAADRATFDEKVSRALLDRRVESRVRLGLVSDSDTQWEDWTRLFVYGAEADASLSTASAKGYQFVVELRDRLFTMSLRSRVKAWRGPLSTIVEQLAAEYFTSWSIEPTQGEYALVQSYQSDFAFLSRLARLASNGSGIGDYGFYALGDTLHFHTRGWQAETVKVLRSNTDQAAPTWSVSLVDKVGQALKTGAAGVTSTVYDPLDGQALNQQTSAADVRQFSGKSYDVEDSWSTPRVAHAGQNRSSAELYAAQSDYARSRSEAFTVAVGASNAIGVMVGDVARLQLSGSYEPYSGLYSISQVKASLSGGTANVVYLLTRGELNSQDGPGVQDPQTPVVTQSEVDVVALPASPLAKVSGGPAGRTVPIQDP